MRKSLVFPLVVSAAVMAAGAGRAAPPPAKPAPPKVAPSQTFTKPVAASSSSSSSSSASDKGKGGAKALPPAYQKAVGYLVGAQIMATLHDTASASSSSAQPGVETAVINKGAVAKAESIIANAINDVVQAAAAEKITVNPNGPPEGGGAGSGTDESRLSAAQGDLGSATFQLKGTELTTAGQQGVANARTAIADAEKQLTIAMDVRPNYSDVVGDLEIAADTLGQIKTPDTDREVMNDKSKALNAIKAAEAAVTSIAQAEKIEIKASASVFKNGNDTGAVPSTFPGVQKALDNAVFQLGKGDTDSSVQSDLKTASSQVDTALDAVKAAEASTGKSGSSSSSK